MTSPSAAPARTVPRRALVLLAVLTLLGHQLAAVQPGRARGPVWTFRAVAVAIAGVALLAFARARGDTPRSNGTCRASPWPPSSTSCCGNIASTYAAIPIPSGRQPCSASPMPLWSAPSRGPCSASGCAAADPRHRARRRRGDAAMVPAWPPTPRHRRSAWRSACSPASAGGGHADPAAWQGVGVSRDRAHRLATADLAAVPASIGAWVLADGGWFMPTWQSVLVIGYIALVPMAVGNACWFAIVGLPPGQHCGAVRGDGAGRRDDAGAVVHGSRSVRCSGWRWPAAPPRCVWRFHRPPRPDNRRACPGPSSPPATSSPTTITRRATFLNGVAIPEREPPSLTMPAQAAAPGETSPPWRTGLQGQTDATRPSPTPGATTQRWRDPCRVPMPTSGTWSSSDAA